MFLKTPVELLALVGWTQAYLNLCSCSAVTLNLIFDHLQSQLHGQASLVLICVLIFLKVLIQKMCLLLGRKCPCCSGRQHPKLCCPNIINASAEIFPVCCTYQCNEKITIVPGDRIIKCSSCFRRMKPYNFSSFFEAVLDCDGIKLKLQLETAVQFFNEDILETYRNDIDGFIEKLLYLDNIDFEYNSKHVITNMYKHF